MLDLFQRRFTVVENRSDGIVITHYLKGTKKEIDMDIENIKKRSKRVEMRSKNEMVVWV